MKNLENIITTKINKINEYSKLKKGRNSVERSKKELFLYKSSEDLINIKQKQLKNVSKLNSILDKDISKINSNLKKGYYIDQGIQEENPEIKTKADELNYIYNKLTTDISMIKNEILLLKNVKDAHNKCDKQISKLNKELETLKERKDLNIYYSEIKAKNKEMNEIKRQQIVANKALDSTKFKQFMNANNRYNNSTSKNKTKDHLVKKFKNKIFLTSDKGSVQSKNKSYIGKEIDKESNTNKLNSININDTYDKINEESLEKKYKNLVQAKIEEKNRDQRKINLEIKELDKENTKKVAELTDKENKKLKIQQSNFDLENLKKLNVTKIKKLNKQIKDLIAQEENYEKQITKKEEALEKLKKIVESINNMQQLRV